MKRYSGMDYLRIDVASQFGLDKIEFEDRIQWVHDNEPDLEMLEETADDYFRYAAAVVAYRQAQKGIATGHLVGLDACASGPQILSTIISCKAGAENTGVIGDTRKDVYTKITETMNDLLDVEVDVTRKEVKSALMPFFYGSQAEPKKIFGEDTEELEAFFEAASVVCPGASKLLPIMLGLWDPEATQYNWDLPDGFQVKYMVKEKVESKVEVDTLEPHMTFNYRRTINHPLEKAAKLPANVTQSIDGYIVRELTARCDFDIRKLRAAEARLQYRIDSNPKPPTILTYHEKMWRKHDMISVEGAEHIDNWNVQNLSVEYCKALLKLLQEKVLSRPSFKVITVHDEFKCHPNYMDHIRQTYIDLFGELANSNILNAILTDIAKVPIHINKLDENLSELIKDAEYPLA